MDSMTGMDCVPPTCPHLFAHPDLLFLNPFTHFHIKQYMCFAPRPYSSTIPASILFSVQRCTPERSLSWSCTQLLTSAAMSSLYFASQHLPLPDTTVSLVSSLTVFLWPGKVSTTRGEICLVYRSISSACNTCLTSSKVPENFGKQINKRMCKIPEPVTTDKPQCTNFKWQQALFYKFLTFSGGYFSYPPTSSSPPIPGTRKIKWLGGTNNEFWPMGWEQKWLKLLPAKDFDSGSRTFRTLFALEVKLPDDSGFKKWGLCHPRTLCDCMGQSSPPAHIRYALQVKSKLLKC